MDSSSVPGVSGVCPDCGFLSKNPDGPFCPRCTAELWVKPISTPLALRPAFVAALQPLTVPETAPSVQPAPQPPTQENTSEQAAVQQGVVQQGIAQQAIKDQVINQETVAQQDTGQQFAAQQELNVAFQHSLHLPPKPPRQLPLPDAVRLPAQIVPQAYAEIAGRSPPQYIPQSLHELGVQPVSQPPPQSGAQPIDQDVSQPSVEHAIQATPSSNVPTLAPGAVQSPTQPTRAIASEVADRPQTIDELVYEGSRHLDPLANELSEVDTSQHAAFFIEGNVRLGDLRRPRDETPTKREESPPPFNEILPLGRFRRRERSRSPNQNSRHETENYRSRDSVPQQTLSGRSQARPPLRQKAGPNSQPLYSQSSKDRRAPKAKAKPSGGSRVPASHKEHLQLPVLQVRHDWSAYSLPEAVTASPKTVLEAISTSNQLSIQLNQFEAFLGERDAFLREIDEYLEPRVSIQCYRAWKGCFDNCRVDLIDFMRQSVVLISNLQYHVVTKALFEVAKAESRYGIDSRSRSLKGYSDVRVPELIRRSQPHHASILIDQIEYGRSLRFLNLDRQSYRLRYEGAMDRIEDTLKRAPDAQQTRKIRSCSHMIYLTMMHPGPSGET